MIAPPSHVPSFTEAGLERLCFPGRVAVIGDIHGEAELLEALLAELGDIPILIVGDVCDRGPDTRRVIDILIEREARGVRGNHEQWLIGWARGDGFDHFALNPMMGGRATLDSYGITATTSGAIEREVWSVPRAHKAWLESLALAVDLTVGDEEYWLTHAGLSSAALALVPEFEEPILWLAENCPRELTWTLTQPGDVPALDRTLIMGHVPVPEPVDVGHVIAIDTGAGFLEAGRLTSVVLPERRFISVAPRR